MTLRQYSLESITVQELHNELVRLGVGYEAWKERADDVEAVAVEGPYR